MKTRSFFRPRSARALLVASTLSLLLVACGGDDANGSASPVSIPSSSTPTPSALPTPTATPLPSSTPTSTPASWTAAVAAMYDVAPSIANCTTGTLKASVRTEVLARINALRGLHGLPAVTYSDADNGQVDASSLMMAANGQLSHTPPTNWLCYTATGSAGAGSSNLVGVWGTGMRFFSDDDFLGLWMTEDGSASIGHRRWILDPFLGKISYGRVAQEQSGGYRADAATLKVFSFSAAPPVPSGIPSFIAYPYGNYPIRYFRAGDYLSFSVVSSATNKGANAGVNFASATITVSNGSTNLTVTDVTQDNQGYGLPNNVQWRVTGLQSNVSYTVRITGIAGAPQSSYQYMFKIVP